MSFTAFNDWSASVAALAIAIVCQSTLFAGLVAGVCWVLRRSAPALRYWCWQIVALKLLLMPWWIVAVPLPSFLGREATGILSPATPTSADREEAREAAMDSLVIAPAETSERATRKLGLLNLHRQLTWRSWLVIFWMGGVAGQVGLLVAQRWRLRRLLSRATPASDPRLLAIIEEVVARLSLRHPPGVVLTEFQGAPFVCGLFRSVLVLPRELAAELDAAQLGDVLLHELGHLKRRDLWWGWLPALARMIYFFHPVAHWACFRIRLERELACDQLAMTLSGRSAGEYAEVLFQVINRASMPAALSGNSLQGLSTFWKRRITMLVFIRQSSPQLSRRMCLGITSAATVACLLPTFHAVARGRTNDTADGRQGSPESASADAPGKASDDKSAAPDAPPRDATQAVSLSGRALKSDEKPVVGAEIYLASVGQHGKLVAQTTTDAQGRYEFRDVALPIETFPSIGNAEHSTFQVFGRKQGLGFAWTPRRSLFLHAPAENLQARSNEPIPGPDERYLPGEKIELDLAFSASARLSGQVVDDRGKPIDGAEVLIWGCERLAADRFAWSKHFSAIGYSSLVPAEIRIRTTGDDGRFEFDDLPTECRFRIRVRLADGPRMDIWAATSDMRQADEPGFPAILTGELKLIFPRPFDVPFQILYGDTGLPAEKVLVQVFDKSGFQENGSTDEQGRVTLRLPPGNYGIKLDPVRGTSYFSVPHIHNPVPVNFDVGEQPPEQPLVFRLHPVAAVDVTVVDAETGAGLAHVDVWEQGDPNEPLSRFEPAYESWDPETRGIWAERPRTDSHGKVRVLFDEGSHQIGVGLFNMPAGYEPVEPNGQFVDCRIGKPVQLKFTLRKR